jgi:hypothetical protein
LSYKPNASKVDKASSQNMLLVKSVTIAPHTEVNQAQQLAVALYLVSSKLLVRAGALHTLKTHDVLFALLR